MIPNENSYCEIDPTTVDRFGIPVLHFHWKFTDYEYNQAKHMQETFRSLIVAMGGTPTSPMPTKEQNYGLAAGGTIIHELGGARMGSDPKTSVVDKYHKAHDVPNLFIVDGSVWVTSGGVNPTSTIQAVSLYIADQMKQRLATLFE